MSLQQTIELKISQSFAPSYLKVINESKMHNVPPGSESHFKLVVVSDTFADQSLVQRHQSVNRVLAEELKASIHALSMETHTAAEWAERSGQTMGSPLCRGGSKAGR